MPISIEKFNKAEKPIEERILDFLAKKPKLGFNLFEIVTACEDIVEPPTSLDKMITIYTYKERFHQYGDALYRLVKQNRIIQGQLEGEFYYRSK